ncbi:MAG: hypothetical protein IPL60_18500 [Ardenticatenia bacterium]|nr:hypothetical protein [Ardenticatenia bacterium]
MTQELLGHEIKRCDSIGQPWPAEAKGRVLAALTDVALAMQTAKETVIGREEAEAAIQHEDRAWLLGAALDARLLREDGAQVTFEHQLFQEYFAARRSGGSGSRPVAGRLLPGRRGLVGSARVAGDLGDPGRAAGRRRRRPQPRDALAGGAEPGGGAGGCPAQRRGLQTKDVEPESRRLLADSAWAKTTEAHPYGRAAAYRVLGVLDADDRKGVGVLPPDANGIALPDIDWVSIPGGGLHLPEGRTGCPSGNAAALRDRSLPGDLGPVPGLCGRPWRLQQRGLVGGARQTKRQAR